MGLQVDSLLAALAKGDTEPGEDNAHWAGNIQASHKFLIRSTQDLLDEKVTDYAQLLVNNNLSKPPFENCYFEFHNFHSKHNVIALAASVITGPVPGADPCTAIRSFARLRDSPFAWDYYAHGSGWKHSAAGEGASSFAVVPDMYGSSGAAFSADFAADEQAAGGMMVLVAAAIAFMDLREVGQDRRVVSDRVRAARARSGKAPLFDHTELFIKPTARAAAIAHHETLLARRAHWRRGHLRHLPDRTVPVRPALIRGEGFVSKDYVLR